MSILNDLKILKSTLVQGERNSFNNTGDKNMFRVSQAEYYNDGWCAMDAIEKIDELIKKYGAIEE